MVHMNCEPEEGREMDTHGNQGSIRDSIKIWKGNVMSEDYHTEMNSEVFGDWFNQEVEQPESED